MKFQIRRRLMLILHDVLMHPIVGLIKALSLSTKPEIAHKLHELTLPPLPECDLD